MNETLQARYDALETEKLALNPNNPDDRFRQTVIEQEQAQIKAQLNADDRLQRQATEVAEIELPEDYDIRFGFAGANDEIRSLISQVKEYLFSQHNDELAKVHEEHQDRIRLVEGSIHELLDEVAALEVKLEEADVKVSRAVNEKIVAQEQLIDAETKRDNAVSAKEESEADRDKAHSEIKSLKGQIDELEGMLRTYRSKAGNGATGGLVLTSTLKPVSEEERKANAERERIEQINVGLTRIGQDPLPLPVSPAEAEAAAASEELDERFPVDEDAHDAGGLDEANETVELAGDPITLEGLNQRITFIEKHLNITTPEQLHEFVSGVLAHR